MDDFRTDDSGFGGNSDFAAEAEAPAPDEIGFADAADARDGDVIQGLRSGLIFSLAIWAMLFGFGTLVFG